MVSFAEIQLRLSSQAAPGFRVELEGPGHQATGVVAPDILAWQPGRSPAGVDAAADGADLFRRLLATPTLTTAWDSLRARFPLRRILLRLDPTEPGLHRLPWELLHEARPDRPLKPIAAAAATPFSRYWPGSHDPRGPVTRQPVRLLAVLANPADLESTFSLTPLDLDLEMGLLQQALGDARAGDLELRFLPQPATLDRLEVALQGGFDLLHVVGHGTYDAGREATLLLLADERNQTRLTADHELAGMIERLGEAAPRLVFLASCQTARQGSGDAFRGLAPHLLEAGVPAVIAMQGLLPIDTARALGRSFYRQLWRHGAVDLALNQARSVVMTGRYAGSDIPVLMSRLPANQLLSDDWPARATRLQQQAQSLLQRHSQARLAALSEGQVALADLPTTVDDSLYLQGLKRLFAAHFKSLVQAQPGVPAFSNEDFSRIIHYVFAEFPVDRYQELLQEAHDVLREALELDPFALPVTLQLARLLLLIEPDRPLSGRDLLLGLVERPEFNRLPVEERLGFGQALVALAADTVPVDKALLRRARALFELHGQHRLVYETDQLLQQS